MLGAEKDIKASDNPIVAVYCLGILLHVTAICPGRFGMNKRSFTSLSKLRQKGE
jgi:hypothetical protein